MNINQNSTHQLSITFQRIWPEKTSIFKIPSMSFIFFTFSEDEIEKAPTMLSLAKEKTLLEKKLSNNEKNNEIVGNDNFSITVIEEADNNVEHIESHKGPCTPPQNNHESLDLAKGPQTPEGIKFQVFLELHNLLCKALKIRYTLNGSLCSALALESF